MGPFAPILPVEYILSWGEHHVFWTNTSVSWSHSSCRACRCYYLHSLIKDHREVETEAKKMKKDRRERVRENEIPLVKPGTTQP